MTYSAVDFGSTGSGFESQRDRFLQKKQTTYSAAVLHEMKSRHTSDESEREPAARYKVKLDLFTSL